MVIVNGFHSGELVNEGLRPNPDDDCRCNWKGAKASDNLMPYNRWVVRPSLLTLSI